MSKNVEDRTSSHKVVIPRDKLTIFEEKYLNYIELLDLFLAFPEKIVYVEEPSSKKLKGIITLESLSTNYNIPNQWMNQDFKFILQTNNKACEEEIKDALPIPVLDKEGILRGELRNVALFETKEEHKEMLIREIYELIDKIDVHKWKNIIVYGYEKEIADFLLEKLKKKGCHAKSMKREEIVLDRSVNLFLCIKETEAQLFRGMFYSKNNVFKISTEIKSVKQLLKPKAGGTWKLV